MAEIFVKVPDNQLSFFMDLITKLRYITAQNEDDTNIPTWHKEVVKNRIDNLKEENIKDWDDVKNSLSRYQ